MNFRWIKKTHDDGRSRWELRCPEYEPKPNWSHVLASITRYSRGYFLISFATTGTYDTLEKAKEKAETAVVAAILEGKV